jgi:acetylornithine deacetylase
MHAQRTIEVLEALVGFDTTSRNSNLLLVEWVEAYLDRFGVPHERVPDAAGTKANLWATIGPPDVPGTILSGHTDVVPVDGQAWTNDPFRLTERNGRVYGRGAADMKGFDACCLAAVPEMVAARLTRPIHLSFSYDEEVGCVGVRGIIARLERAKVKPAACFVGEPTEMGVVIGHKGQRAFRVAVHGKTCHSSLAPHGVNAVDYGARMIVKIREISDRLARSGVRDPLYDVPHTTAVSGVVRGGAALNIVPDLCTFEFEFRPLAVDDVDGLVEEVVTFARERLEPEMQAVDPAARIVFEPKSSWPGLETPAAFDVVGLAKTLAGRKEHSKVAFGTEAGLFAAARIPTVVIGPGSIDQAHKADEYVAVAQLEACRAFLDRLTAHSRA